LSAVVTELIITSGQKQLRRFRSTCLLYATYYHAAAAAAAAADASVMSNCRRNTLHVTTNDEPDKQMSHCGDSFNVQIVTFRRPTSSHHMEKTEAGLKGLYIPEITLKYRLYNIRITTL